MEELKTEYHLATCKPIFDKIEKDLQHGDQEQAIFQLENLMKLDKDHEVFTNFSSKLLPTVAKIIVNKKSPSGLSRLTRDIFSYCCSHVQSNFDFVPIVLLHLSGISSYDQKKFHDICHRLDDTEKESDSEEMDEEDKRKSPLFVETLNILAEFLHEVLSRISDGNRLPLGFFISYSKLLLMVIHYSQTPLDQLLDNIQQRMKTYFRSITAEEARNISRKQIEELAEIMHEIYRTVDPRTYSENFIESRMIVGEILFKLPYLGQRLIGLSELSHLFEVKFSEDMVPLLRYALTYIKNINFVEYLFTHVHIELVKKSSSIIEALSKSNMITESELDLIWRSSLGAHESLTHQVWELIGAFAPFLKENMFTSLFSKIREVPLSDYDKNFLLLIRKLINIQRKTCWSGCQLLWNAFQDNSNVAPEVQTSAIAVLKMCVDSQNSTIFKIPLIEQSLENLGQKKSVFQSFSLIDFILTKFKDPKLVSFFVFERGLIDLWFQNMDHYFQNANKIKNELPSNTNLHEYCFVPFYKHYVFLGNMLKVLASIFVLAGIKLDESKADKLWEIVIEKSVTRYDQDIVFDWLKGSSPCDPKLEYVSEQSIEHIFRTKLPNLNYNMSMKAFELFEYYFRYTNYLNDLLDQSEMGELKILSLDLIGLSTLWSITLNAEDKQVGEAAIRFLNNLQRSFSASLSSRVFQFREEYMDKCVKCIEGVATTISKGEKPTPQQMLQANRSLRLLHMNLESYSWGHSCMKHASRLFLSNVITIKIQATKMFSIQLFDSSTILDLKNEIAQLLELSIDGFKIYNRNRELSNDNYFLYEYRLVDGDIINLITFKEPRPKHKMSDFENKLLPSSILSTEKYFHKFFSFLPHLPNDLCESLWSLLEYLPTNDKVKRSIINIEPGTKWEQILDKTDCFKLCYSLQIIDNILHRKNFVPDLPTWLNKFQVGGLEHLFSLLSTLDQINPGYKNLASVALLLKISFYFLIHSNNEISTRYVGSLDFSNLVNSLLNMICKVNETNPSGGDYVVKLSVQLIASSLRHLQSVTPLIRYPKSDWLETLVFSSSELIRESIKDMLLNLLNHLTPALKSQIIWFVITKFNSKLPSIIENNLPNKNEYFILFSSMVNEAKTIMDKQEDHEKIISGLITSCVDYFTAVDNDLSYENKENLIVGMIELATALFCNHRNTDLVKENGKFLIPFLIHKCLFDYSKNKLQRNAPLCKTPKARMCAFNFLLALCTPTLLSNTYLLSHEAIKYYDCNPSPRTRWNNQPREHERISRFVGLNNLGATCYMNSLIQQFFMNPGFRSRILSVNPGDQENVLYQLQSIFAHLQESERKSFTPRGFCNSYKVDGQPMRTSEQMDADEFFNGLFEKLETLLKGTFQESVLLDNYGGSFITQIKSEDCSHRSEKEEDFFTLSLEVKNKKKLYDSLELYIQGERLEFENKYFCGECKEMVTAVKRTMINKLPNHLIIHLKRFDYDLVLGKRNKLNQLIEFPQKLNLEPFTKEGLERKENPDSMIEDSHPSSYFDYDLTGILIHSGDTEMGHYYSYIRDSGTNKWYQFNDEMVTPFNPEDIPDRCFGGEISDGKNSRSKAFNAYMLFYQKSDYKKSQSNTDIDNVPMTHDLYDLVWRKNMKFLNEKNLFDPSFLHFLLKFLSQYQSTTAVVGPVDNLSVYQNQSYDPMFEVIRLGTKYYNQTLCHSKDRSKSSEYLDALKKLYRNHIPSCQYLLDTLSKDIKPLEEIFAYCPHESTRQEFAELISFVCATLEPYERDQMDEYYTISGEEANKIVRESPWQKYNEKSVSILTLMESSKLCPKSYVLKFLIYNISFCRVFAERSVSHPEFYMIYENCTKLSTQIQYVMIDSGLLTVMGSLILDDNKRSKSNYKHLFGAVASLLTNCKIERSENSKYPSTQTFDTPAYIKDGDILLKLVGRSIDYITINKEAAISLLTHLCYDNQTTSFIASERIIKDLDDYYADSYDNAIETFRVLLEFDSDTKEKDEITLHQIQSIVRVINKNRKFEAETKECLNLIIQTVKHDVGRRFMYENQQILVEWLSLGEPNFFRSHTEEILTSMVPELKGYKVTEKWEAITPDILPSESLPEETVGKLKKIIEIIQNSWTKCKNNYTNLRSLFRLLDWSLQTVHEIQHWKNKVPEIIELFFQLNKKLSDGKVNNQQLHDMNYVRAQLSKIIYKLSQDDTTANVFCSNKYFVQTLLEYHIEIKHNLDEVSFLDATLKYLYQLDLMTINKNESFASELALGKNIKFGLYYFFTALNTYVAVYPVLSKIMETLSEKFPPFRKSYFDYIINEGKIQQHIINYRHYFTSVSKEVMAIKEDVFSSVNYLVSIRFFQQRQTLSLDEICCVYSLVDVATLHLESCNPSELSKERVNEITGIYLGLPPHIYDLDIVLWKIARRLSPFVDPQSHASFIKSLYQHTLKQVLQKDYPQKFQFLNYLGTLIPTSDENSWKLWLYIVALQMSDTENYPIVLVILRMLEQYINKVSLGHSILLSIWGAKIPSVMEHLVVDIIDHSTLFLFVANILFTNIPNKSGPLFELGPYLIKALKRISSILENNKDIIKDDEQKKKIVSSLIVVYELMTMVFENTIEFQEINKTNFAVVKNSILNDSENWRQVPSIQKLKELDAKLTS
eukprot:TRINITY_DN6842_c1_g3_i2.p1 TRINITY_DN6842_c1_g3~~TRINITY_DN6842_c1_g3_i2.p1  ORF type:complete len:2639 (+),score=452.27 TRINITY_DN6842_c1_g3_i2:39-7955(+)